MGEKPRYSPMQGALPGALLLCVVFFHSPWLDVSQFERGTGRWGMWHLVVVGGQSGFDIAFGILPRHCDAEVPAAPLLIAAYGLLLGTTLAALILRKSERRGRLGTLTSCLVLSLVIYQGLAGFPKSGNERFEPSNPLSFQRELTGWYVAEICALLLAVFAAKFEWDWLGGKWSANPEPSTAQ